MINIGFLFKDFKLIIMAFRLKIISYTNRSLGFFLAGISLAFASFADSSSEKHDVLMVREFELSDITLVEGPFRKSMDVNLK